jgi:hypothetical protein
MTTQDMSIWEEVLLSDEEMEVDVEEDSPSDEDLDQVYILVEAPDRDCYRAPDSNAL